MHRMFVYGTLKKGQPNHYLIENVTNGLARYVGEGRTVAKWPLVMYTPYNIPFMLNDPGKGNHIRGDVFEVDDAMLQILDKLEDHPNLYRRTHLDIQILHPMENSTNEMENSMADASIEMNSTIQCQTYLMHDFVDEMYNSPMLDHYDSKVQKDYVPPSKRGVSRARVRDFVKKKDIGAKM